MKKNRANFYAMALLVLCLGQYLPNSGRYCLPASGAEAAKDESQKSNVVGKEPGAADKQEGKQVADVYQFKAKALDGSDINFAQYKGNVLLIVNTASHCGYTPQYAGLKALNKKYSERGLRILGFPCNQFGAQEPGDNKTIGAFCQKNYGVDFQMFDKIDVNGSNAHPLYQYLTKSAPAADGSSAIKWNFTKFLIDKNGHILKRFGSETKPEDIATEIEKQLSL